VQIDSPQAAFIAGLVTSVHCAGMCGPLACAFIGRKEDDPLVQQGIYHGSRVLSYTLLGAIGGAIGGAPLAYLGPWALYLLPWALVAYLVLSAMRLDRFLPKSVAVGLLFNRISARLRKLPGPAMAGGFGLLTPLLPCGPLYAVLALTAFTGGALRGAEFMIAFGLGTVPLLWIAQNRFGWLSAKFGPNVLAQVRLWTALIAAALLTWRLRASFGLPGPTVDSFICH
jgi:uncharacterized protein